jgi:hypothetical protein
MDEALIRRLAAGDVPDCFTMTRASAIELARRYCEAVDTAALEPTAFGACWSSYLESTRDATKALGAPLSIIHSAFAAGGAAACTVFTKILPKPLRHDVVPAVFDQTQEEFKKALREAMD